MPGHHAKILTSADVRKAHGLSVRQLAKLAKTHDGETFVYSGSAGRPFRGYKASAVNAFVRSL